MYFEKFHGTGNDFIIIEEKNIDSQESKLAKSICDRHFGIGADGMMVVKPSEVADLKMTYYNQDGTIAPMCGNGIRCFAKYVYNHGLVNDTVFNIETLAGIISIEIIEHHKHISRIKINLGNPQLETGDFPINTASNTFINQPILVSNTVRYISTLNMGTIHTVHFSNNLDHLDIHNIGKAIENNSLFPQKTNVNFVEIIDKDNLRVETYERGVGRTLACGTGCAASAVISNMLNNTNKSVYVHIKGGVLYIEITDNGVFMTGPAEIICKGDYIVKID